MGVTIMWLREIVLITDTIPFNLIDPSENCSKENKTSRISIFTTKNQLRGNHTCCR